MSWAQIGLVISLAIWTASSFISENPDFVAYDKQYILSAINFYLPIMKWVCLGLLGYCVYKAIRDNTDIL